jgi:hypothetical protein
VFEGRPLLPFVLASFEASVSSSLSEHVVLLHKM